MIFIQKSGACTHLHTSMLACGILELVLIQVGVVLREMFGDEALGAMNIEMVEIARRVGAASKFTGSGGAVVVFCPEGSSQASLLEDECKKIGFAFQPLQIKPSMLTQEDLKTMSSK